MKHRNFSSFAKIISLSLCVISLLALCACGNNTSKNPDPAPEIPPVVEPEGIGSEGYVEPEPGPAPTVEPEQEKDYLTTQVDALSEFFAADVTAYHLGKMQTANGSERHIFLSRVGTNPESTEKYLDITGNLGINSEEVLLVDEYGNEQSMVQSILTNYGTLYIYDFASAPDMSKLQFMHIVSTDNDLVNIALKTYKVPIGQNIDITAQVKLRENSLDVYKLSDTLYAVPESMQAVFDSRETNIEDDGSTTRVNYSNNNNFLVWGEGSVPLEVTLNNISIETYPYYEMNQPAVFQNTVMPYVYTITYSYDEGVITAAMEGDNDYMSARNTIESQFVVTWGSAKINQNTNPSGDAVDINQFIPEVPA